MRNIVGRLCIGLGLLAGGASSALATEPIGYQTTPFWKRALMPWTTTTSSTPVAISKLKGKPTLNGRPLWTPTSQPTNLTQNLSTGSKKIAQGTFDAVTLKPLRSKIGTSPTPKYAVVRQEKKPGLFGSMFKPTPAPTPRTMGEWMALDRPKM
ncbi:MAG: hypothetical protein JSS27_18265 [Planctomycetes bacterium]|nr:hypothetical protein [Planctomycetota bacterium]